MRRVSCRHCPAALAASIRYKSAYFQIPPARRRTKAALYVPAEAWRKDTNTCRQCVRAADNGDSVTSGWRMKTPANKGWREAAASVDGIKITEELKLKTTAPPSGGGALDRFWTSQPPSSRPLRLVSLGENGCSSWFQHVWRVDSTEKAAIFHL